MKTERWKWVAVGSGLIACPLAVFALTIDNFNGTTALNQLGNRAHVFQRGPSAASVGQQLSAVEGRTSKVLALSFRKVNVEGSAEKGGWCGYYTLLKSADGTYFDARGYTRLTFLVKAETGKENFVVGVADRHWDLVEDSAKSLPIGHYLPTGKLTDYWQRAEIPLSEFMVDTGELASIALIFEGELFSQEKTIGKVYLEDLQLE